MIRRSIVAVPRGNDGKWCAFCPEDVNICPVLGQDETAVLHGVTASLGAGFVELSTRSLGGVVYRLLQKEGDEPAPKVEEPAEEVEETPAPKGKK